MVDLYITEYSKLAERNAQAALEPAIAVQKVSFTTSTQSATFNVNTKFVRLVSETSKAHVAFGTDPTATANSTLLPADTPEVFGVKAGHKLAAYDGSS